MNIFPNNGYNPFEGLENPDKKRENKKLDDKYREESEKATPEQTAELKKKAGDILGKNFDPEKSLVDMSGVENRDPENDTSDLENILDSDSLDYAGMTPSPLDTNAKPITNPENKEDAESKVPQSESLYAPILRDLREDGHIDDKVYKSGLEELNTTKDTDEQQQIILKAVLNLSDKSIKQNIEKAFQKPEEQTEMKEDDFEKSEFFQHAKNLNMNLDKGVGGLETMLAKNFISLPKKGETNDQRDVNRSMDIALNSIVSKKGEDFRKNNAELIIDIKAETSLDSKYQQLKNLYKQDLLDDAKKGGKKGREEIRVKKEGLQQQAEKVAIEFKKAKNISDPKEKAKKIQELTQEKEKIIQEGKEIDGFEKELNNSVPDIQGLGGGDNDKIKEYGNSIDNKNKKLSQKG